MDKFAFVHIPKTGGSAFWGLLIHYCDVRPSPHMLMMHYLSGEKRFEGEFDLYGGHSFYELLKDLVPPGTKFMTLLRHPLNRVYSHWNHLITKGVYPKYGFEREIGFSEFIRDIRAIGLASNFQARYLAYKPITPIIGPQLAYQIVIEQAAMGVTDEVLLERARKNLSEFSLVGKQEEFTNAVMRACMLMGFPPPFDVPIKYADYGNVISDEDKKYLLEINKVDLELWSGVNPDAGPFTVVDRAEEQPLYEPQ